MSVATTTPLRSSYRSLVAMGTRFAQPTALAASLPRPLSTVEQQLIAGSNALAFRLLRAVDSAAGPDSNVFISPLSASMALCVTTVGASGVTLE